MATIAFKLSIMVGENFVSEMPQRAKIAIKPSHFLIEEDAILHHKI